MGKRSIHPVLQLLKAPRPMAAIDLDPAWRWSRAVELAKRAAYLPRRIKRSDRLLYRAFHFIRRARGLDGRPIDRLELAGMYPDIEAAVRIRNDPAALATLQIVEALVMSREEPARIVERFPAVPPRVLAAYEALFFDVRDLLHDRLFVLHNLLPLEGQLAQDRGSMLKVVAFLGGADMLLRFVDGAQDFTADQWAILSGIIRKLVTGNAWAAAASVRVTQRNAIELQDFHQRTEEGLRKSEIEAAKFSPSATQSEIEELTGGLITSITRMYSSMPVKPQVSDSDATGSYREPGTFERMENDIMKALAAETDEEPM